MWDAVLTSWGPTTDYLTKNLSVPTDCTTGKKGTRRLSQVNHPNVLYLNSKTSEFKICFYTNHLKTDGCPLPHITLSRPLSLNPRSSTLSKHFFTYNCSQFITQPSMGPRMHCLYLVKKCKYPTKRGFLWMKLNCLWWWALIVEICGVCCTPLFQLFPGSLWP